MQTEHIEIRQKLLKRIIAEGIKTQKIKPSATVTNFFSNFKTPEEKRVERLLSLARSQNWKELYDEALPLYSRVDRNEHLADLRAIIYKFSQSSYEKSCATFCDEVEKIVLKYKGSLSEQAEDESVRRRVQLIEITAIRLH